MTGVTDEMQQTYRDQLFAVDREGLQAAAQRCVSVISPSHGVLYSLSLSLWCRYLVDGPSLSCAVIGPKSNELSSDWTVKNFDL